MVVYSCLRFMHDGAPRHRLKVVTKYLKIKEIQVFNWLANSPDLNPVENLWQTMKDKMANKYPRSLKSLTNA